MLDFGLNQWGIQMKHRHSIGITGYLFILILTALSYSAYQQYQTVPHYIAVYPEQSWQALAYSHQSVSYSTDSNSPQQLKLSFPSDAVDLPRAEYQRLIQLLNSIKDQPVQLRIFFANHHLHASEKSVRHQQLRVQRIAQTAHRYTRSIAMQASKKVKNDQLLLEIHPKPQPPTATQTLSKH